MKAYGYNAETKKFTEILDCQIDPIASEWAGYDVFLTPANATLVEAPPKKEGFDIIWTGTEWIYKPEPVKEPETEPEPTQKERLEMQLWETQSKLDDLDYIGVKIATGRATADEYKDEIAEMDRLADVVNNLKDEIKKLD